jgi:hypothetical protein
VGEIAGTTYKEIAGIADGPNILLAHNDDFAKRECPVLLNQQYNQMSPLYPRWG